VHLQLEIFPGKGVRWRSSEENCFISEPRCIAGRTRGGVAVKVDDHSSGPAAVEVGAASRC